MVRVRFAPSPTGFMHLGNVRTALLNFLFARQKNGSFVLRIEDTDPQRNFDPGAKHILSDLAWLNIVYDEGPIEGGPYAPYFQSKRKPFYQEQLKKLKNKNLIYRCFCTVEELEKKRKRQVALKQPPRYDRTCLHLSEEEIKKNVNEQKKFIWRFKIDHDKTITIDDMVRGTISFDLKNFSDFPLTRADGSFTFIFANCVDDMLMKISYVLRGEDHLSNTVDQIVLYQAFDAVTPRFWHQPMIVNREGKKLSKRDFGFSLNDLHKSGFLPEAIVNYLAIIGGSFEQEIMSLDELIQNYNFETVHHAGHITYDVEKLRWVNHKWIEQLDTHTITKRVEPFIRRIYPDTEISFATLEKLVGAVKNDLHTLDKIPEELSFYFNEPTTSKEKFLRHANKDTIKKVFEMLKSDELNIADTEAFITKLKQQAKAQSIRFGIVGTILRLTLLGSPQGLMLKTIIKLLGIQETKKRIEKAQKILLS